MISVDIGYNQLDEIEGLAWAYSGARRGSLKAKRVLELLGKTLGKQVQVARRRHEAIEKTHRKKHAGFQGVVTSEKKQNSND